MLSDKIAFARKWLEHERQFHLKNPQHNRDIIFLSILLEDFDTLRMEHPDRFAYDFPTYLDLPPEGDKS